ncbi:hypothetical protein ALC57_00604 [Trachymyrmex cornetzi]|uniref:Endonuclease/exonuclease/phosphatase domain-containing protein n=1 Tax=Trachymyrmex cornetzi TaxID=471704 RepID=A0A151JRL3_9HYME|nr:hypothetical protein ALC57_00604 [Trachymyrmex cornetzi]
MDSQDFPRLRANTRYKTSSDFSPLSYDTSNSFNILDRDDPGHGRMSYAEAAGSRMAQHQAQHNPSQNNMNRYRPSQKFQINQNSNSRLPENPGYDKRALNDYQDSQERAHTRGTAYQYAPPPQRGFGFGSSNGFDFFGFIPDLMDLISEAVRCFRNHDFATLYLILSYHLFRGSPILIIMRDLTHMTITFTRLTIDMKNVHLNMIQLTQIIRNFRPHLLIISVVIFGIKKQLLNTSSSPSDIISISRTYSRALQVDSMTSRKKSRPHLRVLQWNCGGARGNQASLTSLAKEFNVICIQESMLKPDDVFRFKTFNVVRSDINQVSHSGICTFIKENIKFEVIFFHHIEHSSVEDQVIKIITGKGPVVLVNLYRHPGQHTPITFFQDLVNALRESDFFLILGEYFPMDSAKP